MIRVGFAIFSLFCFAMATMFLLDCLYLDRIEKEYVPIRTYALNGIVVIFSAIATVLLSY